MRVLVTGATGYVGAFTMKALAEAGHEPVAFARSLERLDAVATALSMPRPDHRLGDMRDRRAVRTALEGCDAVIHCAALVTMDRRAEREMIEGNLEGTRAVLEQAVELGLDPIVHTSSTSALFEPSAGVLTADHPIGAAKMAYARSKAACEAVARGLQERGAPITITYPSGILGPSAGTSLGETATQMAGFVAGGVMPTDRAALSIIDVRDLAALNAALIEPGRGPSRVMCGGHLVTMELLAETLRDLTGRRFPVPRTPPGVLRGAGRLVDALRAVVPFDSAMTYEAMALVTNWEGTDDASMRAAGVRIRPLRDTFVESLSAWADAGLVTERHLGRFRPATPLPPAPPRGLRLPGWVMGSAALRAIGPRVFPVMHRTVHRLSGGRTILDSRASPMMMLIHTGAKSGARRETPLAVVPRADGSFLALGSNFAQEKHPAWTVNLLANPDATIHFRGRDIAVTAELLTGTRRDEAWAEAIRWYPGWVRYSEVSDREFRLFHFVPNGSSVPNDQHTTRPQGDNMGFNLADLHEAISAANPDRDCIVWGDVRRTYGEVTDRSRRLANALVERGIGAHVERSNLASHESGQDHVGILSYSAPEYLETMLGAFKARAVPFNINHKYVDEELLYVISDAAPKALVFGGSFAPQVQRLMEHVSGMELLVQIDDGSQTPLIEGALDYEALLAESAATLPDLPRSPDDLYMLYTGGTTGMPKGVLWRQHDVFIGAMGGIPWGQAEPFESVAAVAEASKNGGAAMMTAAPLMHGAAQWMCFTAFTNGNTVVLPYPADRFDPASLLSTMERERVLTLQIVGDAFARPLVEELAAHDYDLSGFMVLSNGGAAMHPSVKERFFELVPQAMIIDAIGSSETGGQMGSTTTKDNAGTGSFAPGNDTVVVNAAMDAVLSPGSEEVGWLARRGYVPLGYLGDADKTRRTFPEIDGVRYSVPGDRVLWRADGSIEFFGRESATINSGGEKIFAEEVELAVGSHPGVSDVMVVGRPSERWGSEVVAIVAVSDPSVTDDEILAEAALHVARYKLPKAIIRRPELKRSPAGKADYRWATAQAQTPEPESDQPQCDHPQSTSLTAGDPA